MAIKIIFKKTQLQGKLHYSALVVGKHELVVQIITAQCYYTPLLGLADSTRMGIIHYDVDNANHLESTPPSPPPLGELSLDFIKRTYPELFEGLGKLGDPSQSPLSLRCNLSKQFRTTMPHPNCLSSKRHQIS